jgi:hypothetical protein
MGGIGRILATSTYVTVLSHNDQHMAAMRAGK